MCQARLRSGLAELWPGSQIWLPGKYSSHRKSCNATHIWCDKVALGPGFLMASNRYIKSLQMACHSHAHEFQAVYQHLQAHIHFRSWFA